MLPGMMRRKSLWEITLHEQMMQHKNELPVHLHSPAKGVK